MYEGMMYVVDEEGSLSYSCFFPMTEKQYAKVKSLPVVNYGEEIGATIYFNVRKVEA